MRVPLLLRGEDEVGEEYEELEGDDGVTAPSAGPELG